jgi:G3E family GTPase
MTDARIPTTILTGFLGAGKTTLLNRLLTEHHGHRIAVIENEFGEAGIDNEILLQAEGERIVETMNGCICCTIRGDLARMLASLAEKRRSGALNFDRVVIETTGLADPAPVAQTFFAEEEVARDYRIDGVVTVVDASHALHQLEAHREAQAQVGFADRLLVSKADAVAPEDVDAVMTRLRAINARAPIGRTHFGCADLGSLFDINGFDPESVADVHAHATQEPQSAHEPHAHAAHQSHHAGIASFVWRDERPLCLEKLEAFLSATLDRYALDMLRYKGVLNIAGREERIVFQGVHLTFGCEPGRKWASGEARGSVLVFIGRNLPQADFARGLDECIAHAGGCDEGTTSAGADQKSRSLSREGA